MFSVIPDTRVGTGAPVDLSGDVCLAHGKHLSGPVPCMLTFRYRGKIIYGCTDLDDEQVLYFLNVQRENFR